MKDLIMPRLPHVEHAPDPSSLVVGLACAYEATAIFSGERLPTLSRLQKRYRPLGGVVVAWLFMHFVRYEERVVREERELVAESAAERALAKARHLGLHLPRPAG